MLLCKAAKVYMEHLMPLFAPAWYQPRKCMLGHYLEFIKQISITPHVHVPLYCPACEATGRRVLQQLSSLWNIQFFKVVIFLFLLQTLRNPEPLFLRLHSLQLSYIPCICSRWSVHVHRVKRVSAESHINSFWECWLGWGYILYSNIGVIWSDWYYIYISNIKIWILDYTPTDRNDPTLNTTQQTWHYLFFFYIYIIMTKICTNYFTGNTLSEL